jgi:hypothetical protein
LTLDDIQQGNINKFIISNIYNDDLVINGNLVTKLVEVKIDNELEKIYNDKYFYGLSNSFAGNSNYLIDRINGIVDITMSNYTENITLQVDNMIKTISLDNVIQGSNNKYIVNNMYNNDLIINGEVITKRVDVKIDETMSTLYSNIYTNAITNHNIAESDYLIKKIKENVDIYMSNYILELEQKRTEQNTMTSNLIIDNDNAIINKIEKLTLDDIYQGIQNKYIINGIYNNDLVVNGNILSKLINVNIEKELSDNYNNMYNAILNSNNIELETKSLNLYDNYTKLSKYITSENTKINNSIDTIYGIITQYHTDVLNSNQQVIEINNLNNKLDTLTEKYSKIEQILENLGYNIETL